MIGRYSQAPRCPECTMRASLDEDSADALVEVTNGALVAYECPVRAGDWHVRRAIPRVEVSI